MRHETSPGNEDPPVCGGERQGDTGLQRAAKRMLMPAGEGHLL
jgi:hypothetical protein